MRFDHVGIVVEDLGAAVGFYARAMGCRVAWVEALTALDGGAIGAPGESLWLHGALQHAGGAQADGPYLELHHFLGWTGSAMAVPGRGQSRRPFDRGLSRVGFFTGDVAGERWRLSRGDGVRFFTETQVSEGNGLPRHSWAAGTDPWGNVVQIADWPAPSVAGPDWTQPMAVVVLVVADLDRAAEWYGRAFGFGPAFPGVDGEFRLEGTALGLPGEEVGVRRVWLDAGAALLQLEEWRSHAGAARRRVYDRGLGHMGFLTRDIRGDFERLRTRHGVRFYGEPQMIDTGGLKGRWWAYFEDPFGNLLELCDHPTPPRCCALPDW